MMIKGYVYIESIWTSSHVKLCRYDVYHKVCYICTCIKYAHVCFLFFIWHMLLLRWSLCSYVSCMCIYMYVHVYVPTYRMYTCTIYMHHIHVLIHVLHMHNIWKSMCPSELAGAQDPKKSETTPFSLSLLCLGVSKPEDGWPILEEWAAVAKDIFANTYEAHREPVELKMVGNPLNPGDDLKCGCFEANKGASRVSILWFGVLWTYMNMKNIMNEEMSREFDRLVLGRACLKCIAFCTLWFWSLRRWGVQWTHRLCFYLPGIRWCFITKQWFFWYCGIWPSIHKGLDLAKVRGSLKPSSSSNVDFRAPEGEPFGGKDLCGLIWFGNIIHLNPKYNSFDVRETHTWIQRIFGSGATT